MVVEDELRSLVGVAVGKAAYRGHHPWTQLEGRTGCPPGTPPVPASATFAATYVAPPPDVIVHGASVVTATTARKSRDVHASSILPWLLRVSWVVLAFTVGPVLAAALDPRSTAVRSTASIGLWLVWGVVLLATLVPRDVGLTLLRVAAPAAPVAAVVAIAETGSGRWLAALAVSTALLAFAVAFLPEVGWLFVNGSSYGDERRHLLRAPGTLLLGPLPLAWALLVAGVVTGPLLLAAERWLLGAVATVAGWAVAAVVGRALHSLTQRWVVLVPAGLVLKDHLSVADPVLFRRTEIELLRPAPADTDALDLTAKAPGLALELRLLDKVPLVRVVPGQESAQGRTARILFTPTRPGAVLADAGVRRIPVG